MRITFVSDLETWPGGACIGAARLANALHGSGHDVTWMYCNPNRGAFGEPRTWRSVYGGLPRPAEIVSNVTRRLVPALSVAASRRAVDANLRREIERAAPDVVHVHALANGLWNHDSIAQIPASTPLVWTFHDCWSFSGESQYYRTLAGKWVRLKPDGPDRERTTARKRSYFDSRPRAVLAGNSHFTAAAARAALDREVHVAPFGLPLDVLAPIDKRAARRALRLPEDELVIGFIAENPSDELKGFQVLLRALARLEVPATALAIGGRDVGTELVGRTPMRRLGAISQPALLAICYAAADVFVVPSLAEALGLVGMESVACGTPVLGSDVGGIPDVVRPGSTGWLFPRGDSDALAEHLGAIGRDRSRAHALAASCREVAEREWSMVGQAERYLELYRRATAS